MNEAQRQSYLKAMGLTPWVARVALPGAAPSPVLDWPEEEQANAPASAGPVVDVAVPSREPEAPVDVPLAAAESSPAEHAPEASAADALAKINQHAVALCGITFAPGRLLINACLGKARKGYQCSACT